MVSQPNKQNLSAFIRQTLPIAEHKAQELIEPFKEIHFAKNDLFIKEDEITDRYLFLENGAMRSFTFDLEGNEVTTELYTSNQIVFEVSSFFRKTRTRENFQALEECHGWYIHYDQLQHLFHAIPEFREFGRMILVNGFIAFKQRTISLINESAEKRYETLLQTRPELFQKVPLKYIASYLGITDSSLSRIRKELSGK